MSDAIVKYPVVAETLALLLERRASLALADAGCDS
jgi:hypothetical protein